MNQVEQVMIQDLTQQVANLTVDRAAWRARALVAEEQLEQLQDDAEAEESAGDDTNDEVNDPDA